MIEDSNPIGVKCPHSRHFTNYYQHCAQVIFLIAFVLFLIVGISLMYVGFLEYGSFGASSRSLKILGLVALLLCIGFLIAACVIISDCISTAIEQPIEDDLPYEALSPSDCTTSFTTIAQSSSQHTDLTMQPFVTNANAFCKSCSQRFLMHKSWTDTSLSKRHEFPIIINNHQGGDSCEFTDFVRHEPSNCAHFQNTEIGQNSSNDE
uniref:Tetraspanin n=1 Tax=Romanomermis culicivorax TaxID=13658 RepID=A0A915JN60_ROMCU